MGCYPLYSDIWTDCFTLLVMVRVNGSCALSLGRMKVYPQFYGYPSKISDISLMTNDMITTTSRALHVIKKTTV